ncbi:MAG: hypothetical protein IIB37_01810 [Gemmatimonadetes bacterium]|nr:hypothetical protein [Gemmatimonadota bacterium]
MGEVIGVIVGVALGLTRFATIALAVSLGFVFGFATWTHPALPCRLHHAEGLQTGLDRRGLEHRRDGDI